MTAGDMVNIEQSLMGFVTLYCGIVHAPCDPDIGLILTAFSHIENDIKSTCVYPQIYPSPATCSPCVTLVASLF